MVENFTRAVALHALNPQRRDFFTFVAGYCWNAVSTLMFHLATLEAQKISGRSEAYEWLIKEGDLPASIREAAHTVFECRELPDPDLKDDVAHFNLTAQVVHYLARRALAIIGVTIHEDVARSRSSPLFSRSAASFLGVDDRSTVIDRMITDDGSNFYEIVHASLCEAEDEGESAICVSEDFELLLEMQSRRERVNKVRLWTPCSAQRLLNATDYPSVGQVMSTEAACFGWESGVQALLQRLNELAVRETLSKSASTEVASSVLQVARERLLGARVHTQVVTPAEVVDVATASDALSSVLDRFVPARI